MTYFTPKTLRFLADLAANNRRDWFEAHRAAYERDVRTPALRLITAMETLIREVHPAFMASPKKVGGSLFRIHRDTRFSGDKTPYKTHIGITFFTQQRVRRHAPPIPATRRAAALMPGVLPAHCAGRELHGRWHLASTGTGLAADSRVSG